jgi:hypothetical protein
VQQKCNQLNYILLLLARLFPENHLLLIETLIVGPLLFKQGLKALQIKFSEIDFFIHHGDICYADDGPELLPPVSYEQALYNAIDRGKDRWLFSMTLLIRLRIAQHVSSLSKVLD